MIITIMEAFDMQNRLTATTLRNKLVCVILEFPVRFNRQEEKNKIKQTVFCSPLGRAYAP